MLFSDCLLNNSSKYIETIKFISKEWEHYVCGTGESSVNVSVSAQTVEKTGVKNKSIKECRMAASK